VGVVRNAGFSPDDMTSDPAADFGAVESHVHEATDMVPV
jgi:hypothetical protein